VRIAPQSQVTFSALGRFSTGGTISEVDLDQGEAEFKVSAHHDSTFRVNVGPRIILLKHSGRFRVTTLNSDPLEVAVWKGEVAVHQPDNDQEVTVRKDETFALDAMDSGRYNLEKDLQSDDLDEWSDQRDQYLSTYAAGNHASSPYAYGVSDLNYYGQYYDVPGYGNCWQPYGVNLGWDPFMNGYWTYSPAFGNVWVSAYPWGWMPYRYGNWIFVANRGWLWRPGAWNRWNSIPRVVNPPQGFRPPTPPPVGVRVAGPVAPAGNAGTGGVNRFNNGGPRLTLDRNGNEIPRRPALVDRTVITNEAIDARRGRISDGRISDGKTGDGKNVTRGDVPANKTVPADTTETPRHVQPMDTPVGRERRNTPDSAPTPPRNFQSGSNQSGSNQVGSNQVGSTPAVTPPATRVVSPPPAVHVAPPPPVHIAPPPPAPRTYSPPPAPISRPSPPAVNSAPRSFSPPPSAGSQRSAAGAGGRVR
jgi:FecR protein